MNTKMLLLITVFMATAGSLLAITDEDAKALHREVIIKEGAGNLEAGDTLPFNGRQYEVKNLGSHDDISYRLEDKRKFLNFFHWATDTVFYVGHRNIDGTPKKSRNYNYKNITTAGVLFAGCVALVGFAWKNLVPAQQNG